MKDPFFDFPIYSFKTEDAVHDNVPTPQVSESKPKEIRSLAIICEQPQSDEYQGKIHQIMSSIKVEKATYKILGFDQVAEIMQGAMAECDFRNILMFGKPPMIPGEIVPFELHETFKTSHGINSACTASIADLIQETISGEKTNRLALWNFLKKWKII